MSNEYCIDSVRIIDPATGMDGVGWIHFKEGVIVGIGLGTHPEGVQSTLSKPGLIACPGLIDIHVHLREPGGEHKETLQSGCAAAVAGGFTTVCCMPNTTPALDSVEIVADVLQRAADIDLCRVKVIAATTVGRQGRELVDLPALTRAGVVAFSDDGDGIEDDDVCRQVMQKLRDIDRPLFPHCEFKAISKSGVMHAGPTCERFGFVGYDPRGEEAMIERDLRLVAETGAQYHVAHISSAGGVELIRQAKHDGLPVSTEVCPHHLLLCDEDVAGRDGNPDPNFKMSPPLRSRADVKACIEGVLDGTIECIVTDHAPHTADEKQAGFIDAPMGIVGLETSLACAAKALIGPGGLGWPDLIRCMSTNPARILGLDGGTLEVGRSADVTLIDPDLEWTIRAEAFRSKSRNTPFDGWNVKGKAVATIVGGHPVYLDDSCQWLADPSG
ncbi:MAG: dihydroorotase [Phycisphaerae bacterium]|nr:MAG: dihydroorotase [Phycisphaerae bacterium]